MNERARHVAEVNELLGRLDVGRHPELTRIAEELRASLRELAVFAVEAPALAAAVLDAFDELSAAVRRRLPAPLQQPLARD